MSNSNCRIHPWINRSEFQRVFRELYSDKRSLQKHGLGRVSVWKARVDKLPIAVDLTADLVKCSISDDEITDKGVLAQSLGYMIMKFVNNLTEEKQGTVQRRSLVDIGAEIGIDKSIVNMRHEIAHNVMPSIHVLQAALKYALDWLKIGIDKSIVNMRHEIAHNVMPSIHVLQAALKYALDWLKTNFWEKQLLEPELAPSNTFYTLTRLKKLLDGYLKHKLKGEKRNGTVEEQELNQIQNAFWHIGVKSLPVFVDTGYLICTQDHLNQLGLSQEDIFNLSYGLPEKLVDVWKPLLDRLDNKGILQGLLLHIAYVLTQESSYTNRLLYGWIYAIITTYESRTRSLLPYKRLLELSVQTVNIYAPPVLYKLIDLVDEKHLSSHKKVELRTELKNLYDSLNTDEDDNSSECCDKADISKEDSQAEKKSVWTKCMEPINWSSQPFGLLPNQTVSYNNLELDWTEEKEEEEELFLDLEAESGEIGGQTAEKANMDNTDEASNEGPSDKVHQWGDQMVKSVSNNVALY